MGEARVLIEQWRIHFNTLRPHQSIGKKPPAPATWIPKSNAEKALHLSLFPPIPTPQELQKRRLCLQ
ncbi:MAG: integrase core domain-containing protein [Burkholderiaceae bacterium]